MALRIGWYDPFMAIPETYPDDVRAALQRMLDGFEAADPAPVSVAVYGSLPKGTYRPGASQVHVVVILRDASDECLAAVRKPLHAAWSSMRMRPFLLTRDEITRLADVFPIKIADIVEHHRRDQRRGSVRRYRRRTGRHAAANREQHLRNHLIRLRRHYIYTGDDEQELAKAVFGAVVALGVELTALLRVCGSNAGGGTLESVSEPASESFGLDRAMLDRLCAFRKGEKEDDMRGLFFGLIAILERAVQVADELDVNA